MAKSCLLDVTILSMYFKTGGFVRIAFPFEEENNRANIRIGPTYDDARVCTIVESLPNGRREHDHVLKLEVAQ